MTESVRVIPLSDIKQFCWGNTFDLFRKAFPKGVPASLDAIRKCFATWSPLDALCGLLDRDQRRRVIAAQLREYINREWLIRGLGEIGLHSVAESLQQTRIENLEDVPGVARLLDEAREAADRRARELYRNFPATRATWETAGEIELQLGIVVSDLGHFEDPERHHVVMHHNSLDENTAKWIVDELNGQPSFLSLMKDLSAEASGSPAPAERLSPRAVVAEVSGVLENRSADEVEEALHLLGSRGEEIVAPTRSAILEYASERRSGSYWWIGAARLCSLLSQLKPPGAAAALLEILTTDSRVVEFDGVRAAAARGLGTFDDRSLIPRLAAAAETAHAPVLAIQEAIEALGGSTTESPAVIIEKGRYLQPGEAIEYFRRHQAVAMTWSGDDRRYFFSAFAAKVRAAHGEEAALPYHAASLLADPGPDSASWSSFRGEVRSPEKAARLAEKHPLP